MVVSAHPIPLCFLLIVVLIYQSMERVEDAHLSRVHVKVFVRL